MPETTSEIAADSSQVGDNYHPDEVIFLKSVTKSSNDDIHKGTMMAHDSNSTCKIGASKAADMHSNMKNLIIDDDDEKSVMVKEGSERRVSRSPTKSAKKSTPKKQKEEDQFITLTMRISSLLELSKYEIEVDAYRGIYDPMSFQNKYKASSICHNIKDDESGDSDSVYGVKFANPDEYKFYSCQGQLSIRDDNKEANDSQSAMDETHNCHSDKRGDHENCCSNIVSCPCIKSWLLDKAGISMASSKCKSRKKKSEHEDTTDNYGPSNVRTRRNNNFEKSKDVSIDDGCDETKLCGEGQDATCTEGIPVEPLQNYTELLEMECDNIQPEKSAVIGKGKSSSLQDHGCSITDTDDNTSKRSNGTKASFAPQSEEYENLIGNDRLLSVLSSDQSTSLNVYDDNKTLAKCPVSTKKASVCSTINRTSDSINDDEADTKTVMAVKIQRSSSNCQCDYNPLCFASMGGAADDYLNHNVFGSSSSDFKKAFAKFNCAWQLLVSENEEKIQSSCVLNVDADDDSENESDIEVIDQYTPTNKEDISAQPSQGLHQLPEQIESRVREMSELFYKLYKDERFDDIRPSFYDGKKQKTNDNKYINLVNSGDSVLNQEDLRQAIRISRTKIQSYLEKHILVDKVYESFEGSIATKDQVNSFLSSIKDRHKSILFEGYVEKQKAVSRKVKFPCTDTKNGEEIIYCKPVGLRNLGATCYLNSQLQCLSTNLLFSQGLLQGRGRVTINENSTEKFNVNMINAISKMQSLLAMMIYGAQDTVCTGEFAASLGLVNNEMQDPNEFARLLFDRMHESFVQTDSLCGSLDRNQMPLSNLLPSIFKGEFEYTTKCLTCLHNSKRREVFMDLLLPIPEAESDVGEGKKYKKNKQLPTIQDCLDAYLEPELMKDDNKYYCSQCNNKNDAERSIRFSRIPAVLNLQLARYAYDFKSGRKSKLMNPVLTNRTLNLKTNNGHWTTYVLCAIQNHRGKSALSGHYVAEAMDWSTGTWFEFDDETVSILEDGPSCSFGNDEDVSKAKGTSDAYNLFYVEEACLQKSVNLQLRFDPKEDEAIVNEENAKRAKSYGSLLSHLLREEQIIGIMNCRRFGLMKFVLEGDGLLQFLDKGVWVDGDVFRRFMSCKDTMDDVLSNATKAILNHDFMCKHGIGLHPLRAHRGKFLSGPSFEAYLALLYAEKRIMMEDEGVDPAKATLCDNFITRKNLKCTRCEESYRCALTAKVEKIELIVRLYSDLDPTNDIIDIQSVDGDIFAISRSFISNFRKLAMEVMKKVTDIEVSMSDETQILQAGLGAINFEELLPWCHPVAQDSENEVIDLTVNEKISCEHKRSNVLHNQRLVRYVTKSTFADIKLLFPNAIPLPVQLNQGIIEACKLCSEKKQLELELPSKLLALVESHSRIFDSEPTSRCDFDTARIFSTQDHDDVLKVAKIIQEKCPPRAGREVAVGKAIKAKLMTQFFDSNGSISQADELSNSNPIDIRWPLRNHQCQHGKSKLSEKIISSKLKDIKYGKQGNLDTDSVTFHLFPEDKFQLYASFISQLQTLMSTEYSDADDFSSQQQALLAKNYTIVRVKDGYIVSDPESCGCSCCVDDGLNGKTQKTERLVETEQLTTADDTIVQEIVDSSAILSQQSNIDNSFTYKVYEFDSSFTAKTIQTSLDKICTNDINSVETENHSTLRRSSRKRISEISPILFQGDKSGNLANFRLRICEQTKNDAGNLIDQKLYLFKFDSTSQTSVMIPFEHEPHTKEMTEILDSVKDDPYVDIVLHFEATKKRKANDEANQALMEELMCIGCDGDIGTKSKRKRSEEKGFQGTFLQSSTVQTID